MIWLVGQGVVLSTGQGKLGIFVSQGQVMDKSGTSQGFLSVRDKPGTYKIFDLSQGTFSNTFIFFDLIFQACISKNPIGPISEILSNYVGQCLN